MPRLFPKNIIFVDAVKLTVVAIFGRNFQYHLGYALSGGGAKGFAHLGAFKVFESYGLKPDIIAGTSAGALAGVFYADGFTPDEIGELFKKSELREQYGLCSVRSGLSYLQLLRQSGRHGHAALLHNNGSCLGNGKGGGQN